MQALVVASDARLDDGDAGDGDYQLAILLKTAILLFSKMFTLSKQKTISTEAQLRQAAKEALRLGLFLGHYMVADGGHIHIAAPAFLN